jgi:hypothetical protein
MILAKRLGVWLAVFVVAFVVAAISPAIGQNVRLPDDWAPEYADWDCRTSFFTMGPGNTENILGRNTLLAYACTAYKDALRGPLPEAYSHRYEMRCPHLHEKDLFPLLGHLYAVEEVKLFPSGWRATVGTTRLPQERLPDGIQMRYDTYIFPLMDQTDSWFYRSGALHRQMIYFWAIASTKDVVPSHQAKIGSVPETNSLPIPPSKIVWHWYREGDWMEIAEYRHKLLKIVPPREPKELNRGKARMVGWIELDRHAEPLPAGKPTEKGKCPAP